jgi:hypothetical protein
MSRIATLSDRRQQKSLTRWPFVMPRACARRSGQAGDKVGEPAGLIDHRERSRVLDHFESTVGKGLGQPLRRAARLATCSNPQVGRVPVRRSVRLPPRRLATRHRPGVCPPGRMPTSGTRHRGPRQPSSRRRGRGLGRRSPSDAIYPPREARNRAQWEVSTGLLAQAIRPTGQRGGHLTPWPLLVEVDQPGVCGPLPSTDDPRTRLLVTDDRAYELLAELLPIGGAPRRAAAEVLLAPCCPVRLRVGLHDG